MARAYRRHAALARVEQAKSASGATAPTSSSVSTSGTSTAGASTTGAAGTSTAGASTTGAAGASTTGALTSEVSPTGASAWGASAASSISSASPLLDFRTDRVGASIVLASAPSSISSASPSLDFRTEQVDAPKVIATSSSTSSASPSLDFRTASAGEATTLSSVNKPGVLLRTDEVGRHAVHLVVIDGDAPRIVPFASFASFLRPGDILVVNDAATLPASLHGATVRGDPFELRLSAPIEGHRLVGILFGRGDHRTRTEHREPPPPIAAGELVSLGSITARVEMIDGRRIELVADVSDDMLWQAIYAAGAPVQYAHRPDLLPLYAVQTAYAARPWAVEMPSAGRPLTWDVLLELRRRGVGIATLTHAAGLSSTGDDVLDAALPWPEHYEIPERTAQAIAETKQRGGRVIAIGTTVVRALEAAGGNAGQGVATLRLDARYQLRIVDGIVSGLHAPGESHFELLSAFAPRERLVKAIELAAAAGLSSHELGDTCLVLNPTGSGRASS